ncbi:MAG TPA: ATP-binding protein [Terriglobales bacterium]|jgi:two-component system nitrogen regulation sensor histidine kinase NtrY|nr:ATP-binding protein [Terriglobales bacterium]
MSFRKKLLLLFAATVLICVAVISISVYSTIRRSFEQADQDRANAVAAQFRSEFQHRGSEVERKVESVAASEVVQRIALDMNRGGADPSEYVGEARSLASQQRLDFLELVDARGTILSSAQWQAKFGYPEAVIPQTAVSGTSTLDAPSSEAAPPISTVPAGPFLKREELPDGASLGLFAVRVARVGEQPLYVIGGERLDQAFLSTLDIPAGTRVMLYQNLDTKWNPKSLLDLNGPAAGADQISPLIAKVRDTGQESERVIHWTADPADAEVFHAIPLTGPNVTSPAITGSNTAAPNLDASARNRQLLGVLLVGSSRRPLIELQRHVISTAVLVGGAGILAAVLASLWFAARVSRPVISLAEASRRVAAGDLNAKVEVESNDELGELAASFNRMTEDLVQQKDRAVQAERVAAWRELARRLAHELKNPLFPLQVTVENLMRAKEKSAEMFEEVFHESTATLLEEINNLKTIIGRFSEFSRMPQPQRHPMQVNDVVRSVLRVFQAQLQNRGQISVRTELADALPEISADSDLLHRALQNLVLNAIDAMPQGGELTIRTASLGDRVELSVSDTGSGLTQEECGRLFTPYYTTKQHGTGLGLAIVQSVVSDHGGKISVESTKEKGTTFRVELPRDFSSLSPSLR